MNERETERSARAQMAGSGEQKFSTARLSGLVKPPILVVKNDNTRLHAFNTVGEFVDHEQGQAFDTRSWDLFDSQGTELEVVQSRSGPTGVTATGSQTLPAHLVRRMRSVMDAVEERIEHNPPDPELGIDVSILEQLRQLPYDQLLNELTKLFWGSAEEPSDFSIRPSASPQFRRSRPQHEAGTAAATAARGSARQQSVGPSASDVIVGKTDPHPHSRGWWHNTWGH
jgi:hypothetical protein